MKLLFFILLLAPAALPAATIRYVNASASGANNGTTWADAWTTATAAESGAARDTIVYVADGTYSGTIEWNTANSGSQVIELRKATAADHGSDTGWTSGMGDGQATFGSWFLEADYLTINGVTRNESEWHDDGSYGFRFNAILSSTAVSAGVCSANVVIQYVNAGGPESETYTGSESTSAIYIGGFDELCSTWTISRCYLHNIRTAAQLHMNGVDGITIERCWVSNGWGKEGLRGQIAFKNATVRYNVFRNASQHSGTPEEGCTAPIAIWDGGANAFDNVSIYGNVIFYDNAEVCNGGSIILGGDGGVGWAGSPANNGLIYNNTIAGFDDTSLILINGGTGNEVRNTIWYDCFGSPGANPNTSNNSEESSDPFVNYAGGNLRLAAALAGTSLSSPYNTDPDGVTRGADGTFDRGAFEFGNGSPPVSGSIAASIGVGRSRKGSR